MVKGRGSIVLKSFALVLPFRDNHLVIACEEDEMNVLGKCVSRTWRLRRARLCVASQLVIVSARNCTGVRGRRGMMLPSYEEDAMRD